MGLSKRWGTFFAMVMAWGVISNLGHAQDTPPADGQVQAPAPKGGDGAEEVEPIFDSLDGLDLGGAPAAGNPGSSCCGNCSGCCGCSSCGYSLGNCCCRPWLMGSAFTRFDGWKSQLDDDDNNNFGARVGANFSHIFKHRIGLQAGLSYGAYDWHGRNDLNEQSIEQQLFVTTGVFLAPVRNSCCWKERISAGLVYDRLSTDSATEEGVDFSIGQLRYRAGYWTNPCNEWGVWGTINVDKQYVDELGRRVNTVTQGSVFWRHLWQYGGQTTAYLGVAEEPGEVVFGCNGEVPLSCSVSCYGGMHYILPGTQGGDQPTNNAYAEETWNVSVGMTWYFGCGAKLGSPWLPLQPVADNGTMALRVPTGGF